MLSKIMLKTLVMIEGVVRHIKLLQIKPKIQPFGHSTFSRVNLIMKVQVGEQRE